jgi:hypothetical protein
MLCVTLLVTGCSSDPISYSAPVGISLKLKSVNTANGSISDEKAITTEVGNPYAAFVNDARARLGRDPAVIDVEAVDLTLGANSTGATTLGEIFDGQVEVLFEMNVSMTSYSIATKSIGPATGAGPIGFATSFAANTLPDVDYNGLLNGSFKAVARGPAAEGFSTKGADCELEVMFTFAAFE